MDLDDVKQDCWLELVEDSRIESRKDWPINSIKRAAVHSVRRHTAKKMRYSDFSVDANEVEIEADQTISDPVFKITLQKVFRDSRKDQVRSFILHNLHGYTFSEISQLTGVSLDKVRRGHERIRGKLMEAVNENR